MKETQTRNLEEDFMRSTLFCLVQETIKSRKQSRQKGFLLTHGDANGRR